MIQCPESGTTPSSTSLAATRITVAMVAPNDRSPPSASTGTSSLPPRGRLCYRRRPARSGGEIVLDERPKRADPFARCEHAASRRGARPSGLRRRGSPSGRPRPFVAPLPSSGRSRHESDHVHRRGCALSKTSYACRWDRHGRAFREQNRPQALLVLYSGECWQASLQTAAVLSSA